MMNRFEWLNFFPWKLEIAILLYVKAVSSDTSFHFKKWIAKLEKPFCRCHLRCSQSFLPAILFSFLAANWIKDCFANHGIWRWESYLWRWRKVNILHCHQTSLWNFQDCCSHSKSYLSRLLVKGHIVYSCRMHGSLFYEVKEGSKHPARGVYGAWM